MPDKGVKSEQAHLLYQHKVAQYNEKKLRECSLSQFDL